MNNTYILYALIVFMAGYFAYQKISESRKIVSAKRENERLQDLKAQEDAILQRKAESEVWQKRFVELTKTMEELHLAMTNSCVQNAHLAEADKATFIAITESTMALTSSVDAIHTDNSDATKLLAGTLKACEAIAEATTAFRDEVAEFRKLIAPPTEPAYPKDSVLQPRTEEQAEKMVRTFEQMLRGIPLKQAEEEAEEEAQKKTMFGATDIGMEE